MPGTKTQEITASILVKGQLSTPAEFADIVLKANPDGSTVRVGDVARVEIGSQEYQFSTRLNGKPSTAVSVQLSPGANALSTATLVRAKMDELARYFPANVEYKIPYDTSPFVKVSITKAVYTLGEAMLLVGGPPPRALRLARQFRPSRSSWRSSTSRVGRCARHSPSCAPKA